MFEFEILWPIVLLVFFIGTAIGSFLNVVILRHEKGGAPTGRSHCPHCNKTLTALELIPLVSYFIQFGKCKNCKSLLSVQYPLVEFSTGTIFVLVFLKVFGPLGSFVHMDILLVLRLLFHLIIWSLFVIITVYDFRTKLIPNIFSYSLALSTLILLFIENGLEVFASYWTLSAGIILYIPFYLLWVMSNGKWLGLGDAKLALGIGWYLGLSLGGTAIMLAFWIGAFVSVLLIMFQKLLSFTTQQLTGEELTLKSEIPFGPFLIFGTLVVYLYGMNLFESLIF